MSGYNELAGSPRESLNEASGSSAERRFLVPMSSRLTFVQNLLLGTAYPHFPQARMVSADLQPWTEDLIPAGTIIAPELSSADYGTQPCLVTVKYGPDYTKKAWPTEITKPTVRFGTELRYQIRGSGKFLLVPTSSTKWASDEEEPVPEDANASIVIPMVEFMLQWDFVDDPPISRFQNLLGRVNSGDYLGAPAETLLFENYDITETFRASPINPHTNRVSLKLTQRKIYNGGGSYVGWNHEYTDRPEGWQRMLLSNGENRYPTASFGDLFT